jgi:hypothetical protein
MSCGLARRVAAQAQADAERAVAEAEAARQATLSQQVCAVCAVYTKDIGKYASMHMCVGPCYHVS